MKKAFLYLVTLTAIFASSCNDKKALLDSAQKAINDSDYKKGILICNEILIEDSANLDAYIKRGICYENLKDYKNATGDYSTAIHLAPKSWRPYMLRGSLLCMQQHCEFSVPDFTMSIANAPNDSLRAIAYACRASSYFSQRRFDSAMTDARRALSHNPRITAAMVLLGEAYSEAGQNDYAIHYLKKAIDMGFASEEGYTDLAFVYSKMGEHQKAIEINDQLLAKHPNQPYALNNRGYSKMQLNDFAGAMDDINHSIRLDAGNSYAFRNRGLLYLKLNKPDSACADFQAALTLDFTRYYGNEVAELVKKYCNTSNP